MNLAAEAPSLQAVMDQATRNLQAASASARVDIEALLQTVLNRNSAWLIAHADEPLPPAQQQQFEALLERRLAGEPVAYIVGHKEFWSLKLAVTPDVLIPRPETELVVEQALRCIPPAAAWTVADLGTGSGAIALALASERPRCRVIATDRSAEALALAEANGERLGLTQVEFRQGDWLQSLGDERCHVILSNPPYVGSGDPHLGRGDLRWEPHAALQAGADGLDALRIITADAPGWLQAPGWLVLEHAPDQAAALAALLSAGGFAAPHCYRDHAGHTRVTCARHRPAA